MNFDVNKLKELNELDFDQVAIWSKEVKIVVVTFVIIVVSALSYWFIVKPRLPVLEQAQVEEQELKGQFQAKYRIAVNLSAYIDQLKRIEADFSSMLRSLPTSNETPGLLDDITYVGTTSGLTFKLLNWQQEVPKEFYTELPIEIEVSGGYHNFGEFVSEIADLPRIVTVHDFDIVHEGDRLNLQMQAKTYRTSVNGKDGAEQP